MGEKSTSPAKLGTNGWVVITVVIVLDTAFIKKLGGYLAPVSRPLRTRVFWPALNPGAWAVLVATVSFFRNDDLDALDVPHLLALCFYPWLSGLLWVILSAVLGSLSLVYLFSATCLH